MSEERICAYCGRANPVNQPRCISCGQRAQGTILLAEESPVTATAATSSAWWSASTESSRSTIPVPPQVRDEQRRVEEAQRMAEKTRREIDERRQAEERKRAETVRRMAEMRERYESERAAVAASRAQAQVSLTCPRCGVPTEVSGTGFSFCLRCGSDVTSRAETSTAARPQATTATTVATGPVTERQHRTTTTRTTVTTTSTTTQQSTIAPGVSALLSFLIPGIGQLLNAQVAKGALLLLGFYALVEVFGYSLMGPVVLVGRVLAAVDAYRIAERRQRGSRVREGEWDIG